MQKILLMSITMLTLLTSVRSSGEPVLQRNEIESLSIRSEYRQDSLDFEENEKNYFREKISVQFSKASKINTACVQTNQGEEKQVSWNIILGDISPATSLLLGHFYTNFGAGLLIGKPSLYNPDPFSRVRTMEEEKARTSFIPCNSGNSAAAMQGIGLSYFKRFKALDLSFNGFYSSKKRFVDEESYEEEGTTSALWTIESRDKARQTKTEPVELIIHGCSLSIELLRLIRFEIHYMYTGIAAYSGREIAWDRWNSEADSRRTTDLTGAGFSVQYQDDYIKLFFEGDQIRRTVREGTREESVTGTGLISGVRITTSPFRFSLSVKNTEKNFYSPYESTIGERYPERGWFMDTEIRPLRGLKTGGKLSSERKNSAGSRDKEIPITSRESLFLSWSRKKIPEIRFQVRRTEKTASGSSEEKRQFKGTSKFLPFSAFQINFSGTYQTCNSTGPSNFLIAGITVKPGKVFSLTGSYGRASISEGNPLYAVISPIRYSNIPGAFVREHAHIFVARSALKYKGFFLSFRYFEQRGMTEAVLRRVEFIGSGFF